MSFVFLYVLFGLLAFSLLLAGDIFWLIYLAIFPFLFYWLGRARGFPILLASGIVLLVVVLHVIGFKIYGSAEIYDNNPLPNAQRVVGLERPNLLVLESGEKVALEGLQIRENNRSHSDEAFFYSIVQAFNSHKLAIDPDSDPLQVELRIMGWCGNTFTPHFFPRRVGGYQRMPLTQYKERFRFGIFEPIDQSGVETAESP